MVNHSALRNLIASHFPIAQSDIVETEGDPSEVSWSVPVDDESEDHALWHEMQDLLRAIEPQIFKLGYVLEGHQDDYDYFGASYRKVR